MPVSAQLTLHELSPSVYRSSSLSSKVLRPPESRVICPPVVVVSCDMIWPSKLALKCVDIGILEFGSLVDGGGGNFPNQSDTEHTSFHDSLGFLQHVFYAAKVKSCRASMSSYFLIDVVVVRDDLAKGRVFVDE